MENRLPRPNVINVGSRLYSKYLKDGWYAPANGYAWMQKKATVVLRGPLSQRVANWGYTVLSRPDIRSDGPLIINRHDRRLQISVVGTEFHMVRLAKDHPSAHLAYKHCLDEYVVQDPRAFGLFGSIEVTVESYGGQRVSVIVLTAGTLRLQAHDRKPSDSEVPEFGRSAEVARTCQGFAGCSFS